MAYRIEPATFAHIPWLRMLFMRWITEQPMRYPSLDNEEYDNFVINISRQLTMNPEFALFVAIKGRRVVGFLGGEIQERPIGKPHRVARAHWLYVVPKHRHNGVAQLLIATGLSWLAERDVPVVELAELATASKTWEARGFKPFLMNYYLPVDAIAQRLHPNGHDAEAVTNG